MIAIMKSPSERLCPGKPVALLLLILAIMLLFQGACVSLEYVSRLARLHMVGRSAQEHLIFRSDEHILCLLGHDETPLSLAKTFLGDPQKAWQIAEANEEVPFQKDQVIVIPLKKKNKGGITADGYQVIPILSYHHLSDQCASSLCVSPFIFEQQMEYLKNNGFRVISLEELYDFLQYRRAIPKKSVVITIDDGYRSAYDFAYPILKQHGFKATIFVYSDFIGTSLNAVTWDQLREMKADGFEVGSHSVTHCDLTKKIADEDNKAFRERIEREILVSKQIIDKELSQDTRSIAYPYGKYNQSLLSICEQGGYRVGLSVQRGGNPFFADPLSLKRDMVGSDMLAFIGSLETFHYFPLGKQDVH